MIQGMGQIPSKCSAFLKVGWKQVGQAWYNFPFSTHLLLFHNLGWYPVRLLTQVHEDNALFSIPRFHCCSREFIQCGYCFAGLLLLLSFRWFCRLVDTFHLWNLLPSRGFLSNVEDRNPPRPWQTTSKWNQNYSHKTPSFSRNVSQSTTRTQQSYDIL